MMEWGVCGRVRVTDRPPIGCFDLFTNRGGRSASENVGVRDRIRSLEKAAVRRETRNIWKKIKER